MNYIPITDNQQQTSSSAETETRTVEPAPKKAKLNTATEIAKVIKPHLNILITLLSFNWIKTRIWKNGQNRKIKRKN